MHEDGRKTRDEEDLNSVGESEKSVADGSTDERQDESRTTAVKISESEVINEGMSLKSLGIFSLKLRWTRGKCSRCPKYFDGSTGYETIHGLHVLFIH